MTLTPNPDIAGLGQFSGGRDTVAILDTGVDAPPDLAGKLLSGWNVVGNSSDFGYRRARNRGGGHRRRRLREQQRQLAVPLEQPQSLGRKTHPHHHGAGCARE